MKPYSQACENNKVPILNVLIPLFEFRTSIFEIGSGTGQHAVFFAEQLPHVIWHTSDRIENHAGIIQWIEESDLSNINLPLVLDVSDDGWPKQKYDAVFTANTCHIMHWHNVQDMFKGVKNILEQKGLFVIYGPFNYQNDYTSESNRQFDQSLKANDPCSGIRNFEDIENLANESDLVLSKDVTMPANNRLLVFQNFCLS